MRDQVLKTIQMHNMISSGDRVVIGVSGGADSIALLHIFKQLERVLDIELYVAHVHHGLRGEEADKDAEYVEDLCRSWGIPFFLKKANVRQLSKEWSLSEEDAGREIRFGFFRDILTDVNGDKIALAHHKNDQAETILHHILRGTGMTGLQGIKPVRDGVFIRPLLEISRNEILEYCSDHSLSFRVDATNDDITYTRNRIRHRLIPMIEEEYNPNFVSALTRMANMIRDEDEFIENYCNELFQKHVEVNNTSVKIPLLFLLDCHIAIQRRLLRIGFDKLQGGLKGLQANHVDAVVEMALTSQVGALIQLPNGVLAYKDYNSLALTCDFSPNHVPSFCYPLNIPGEVTLEELDTIIRCSEKTDHDNLSFEDPLCVYIDRDRIQGRLFVRNRREGDIFKPFGLKGTKKLKDYFIDKKIPRSERDGIPLVLDDNNIVWVMGYQINEDYKVSSGTKCIIQLKGAGIK